MRFFIFTACALFFSLAMADDEASTQSTQEPAALEADAPTASKDSSFAPAVFKVIESTQLALDEMYDGIESEMANTTKTASKRLLAHPVVFKGLIKSAEVRFEAEKAAAEEALDENPGLYAKMAMAGLQTSLRQSPGVMTRPELISRARLISEVAKYYNKKDPSMCRYLPQDFTLLLNVDAPWIGEVEESFLESALEGESNAVIRMYSGVTPVIISDVDRQSLFSKFAAEWFSSLSPDEKARIAVSRNSGNYCVLWNIILNDAAKMSEAFPKASTKVLLPLLTMPTRGWLDVDNWGFTPKQ